MNQIRPARRAIVLATAALMLLHGCRDYATAPSYEALVRTEQAAYDIPAGSTSSEIEGTLTNTLDETILLDGFGRDLSRMEKWVDGSWRTTFVPGYPDIWVPPIELEPGESRTLRFWIHHRGAYNTLPPVEHEGSGTYRAVFLFGRNGKTGPEAYSNPFEVRLAR